MSLAGAKPNSQIAPSLLPFDDRGPLYVYTSAELKRIEEGLTLLLQEVVLFKNRVPRASP
jgi:hypothetical protein